MSAEWTIQAPGDYIWTPEEAAQIARAAQAFQAQLPSVHPQLVSIDGLGVLDGKTSVTWPQTWDDAPHSLRMKGRYMIPGLDGVWRIMGLETTDMAADGKATLRLVREE